MVLVNYCLQIYCCRRRHSSSFLYERNTLPAMLTWNALEHALCLFYDFFRKHTCAPLAPLTHAPTQRTRVANETVMWALTTKILLGKQPGVPLVPPGHLLLHKIATHAIAVSWTDWVVDTNFESCAHLELRTQNINKSLCVGCWRRQFTETRVRSIL